MGKRVSDQWSVLILIFREHLTQLITPEFPSFFFPLLASHHLLPSFPPSSLVTVSQLYLLVPPFLPDFFFFFFNCCSCTVVSGYFVMAVTNLPDC